MKIKLIILQSEAAFNTIFHESNLELIHEKQLYDMITSSRASSRISCCISPPWGDLVLKIRDKKITTYSHSVLLSHFLYLMTRG